MTTLHTALLPEAPDRRASIGRSGRFPQDASLAAAAPNLRHDLAGSTSGSLRLGELLALLGGPEPLRDLELGYGSPAGALGLRRAVAEACGVAAEQVLTTQGAMLGLFLLAFELCRPGTDVLLVSPCFSPARDTLASCGACVRTVRLEFDERYKLDPDRVAADLSPSTRLVSVASPQNPSGTRVPEATIRAILAAMTAHAPGALLLVDETYREATYDRATPPQGGALCCARLRPGVFGARAVARFWASLPAHGLRLGRGAWFGEEARVFRLGFGHLPPGELALALAALSRALDGAGDGAAR